MSPVPNILQQIRTKKPLIHLITNRVTINFVANGLLAAGGSPMCAHHPEEVSEAAAHADALVLNLGTLEPEIADGMILAGKTARASGVPVVLDPVGAGLSRLRAEALNRIIQEVGPDAICGNAAEIGFLAGERWAGKGVDGDVGGSVDQLACRLAKQLQTTLIVTGKIDVITNGEKLFHVEHGSEMMRKVTGTGCLATAMVGLFLAKSVAASLPTADRAAAAMTMVGLCGEKAAKISRGPGSFQSAFLDQLYSLTDRELSSAEGLKQREVHI
ncbi:hydroxyethylthiazole kinase [Brevibacillus massiliensis]|jgi:hydroxyethylthiazole kinase|uniref:hydroxyethylthiazole kinase n=1 Tax=Brevibacillus massiliensis TaxID=1118054 RepID=UPI000313E5BB|nr:hydroxyethylthiazole kinase [Brevibacillus massiliensis]